MNSLSAVVGLVVLCVALQSCASTRPPTSSAHSCYELFPDFNDPDASSVGPLPRFIVLDSGTWRDRPERDDVIRFYAKGGKRTPFWRQEQDSLSLFFARSKFTQLRFRLLATGEDLSGMVTYSNDVGGIKHPDIAIVARRTDVDTRCEM